VSQSTLRIVQLNIGSLLEPGWPERRLEVVAWMERLQPDVVCFEEVWEDASNPNTAGWIADRLPWLPHWHFGGDRIGERLWKDPSLQFGSAVLSRWPIDDATYHRLPVADVDQDDPFVTDVPWELLHVQTAGLDVFACHLSSAPTHGLHRRRQVLAIDSIVRAARAGRDAPPRHGAKRPEMPAIVCGDFNAEPDSDEIRFLCSLTALDGRTTFFQDAWRMAGDGPGWTQDWRTNRIAAEMGVNRKRIDYVFVGDPFQREGGAGRILSADLAFHEPITGVQASDHTGLVVDVLWPDRPALP
jgi:endonuclease/exonuclease/phosphatase family metal-dependent hydrolase